MSIIFSVQASSRIVNYSVDQHPSLSELREFLALLRKHPSYKPGFHLLGDHRSVAGEPSQNWAREFAGEIWTQVEHLGHFRWAIVTSTPGGLAAARVLGLLTHGSGIVCAPFITRELAAVWVGAGPAVKRSLELAARLA